MMIVMMRIKNPLETMNYKIMLMMMLIMMTRLKIMIMIMMIMITGLMMTLLDRIYKSVVDTMKRQGWFAEELFHYLGKEKERERGVTHFFSKDKGQVGSNPTCKYCSTVCTVGLWWRCMACGLWNCLYLVLPEFQF